MDPITNILPVVPARVSAPAGGGKNLPPLPGGSATSAPVDKSVQDVVSVGNAGGSHGSLIPQPPPASYPVSSHSVAMFEDNAGNMITMERDYETGHVRYFPEPVYVRPRPSASYGAHGGVTLTV